MAILPNYLQCEYKKEYDVLKQLFGTDVVDQRIDRLNVIHAYTEALWSRYTETLPQRTVKYLLIAESPPWSEHGPPQYFLDPTSRSRSLIGAFRRAFFPDASNDDLSSIIKRLAQIGLLLVDSIPFSLNYTGVRNKTKYRELVGLTVYSYMLRKMNSTGLHYAPDMKIVFGYQKNAIEVINALGGVLNIRDREFMIDQTMISTNAANYPDAKRIREILNIIPA